MNKLLRARLLFGALVWLVGCALAAHAAPSQTGTARLMQGPMLGAVGPDFALVWVRASGEYAITARYGTDPALEEGPETEAVQTGPAEDFTAVVRLTGLQPATTYYYRILLNGQPDAYKRQAPPIAFRTAPAPGEPAQFSVAFGSCARLQQDPVQRIWNAAAELAPDFFIWTGDNVYGDSLHAIIVAEEYRRQREIPSIVPFLQGTPQLAVWDDHDFGLNDHDRTNPVKADMLKIFKQYWPNTGYGTPETPGVFFTYSYGGVDFIMLDCRYHRDPNAAPDTPEKTLLGAGQLAWLKEELKKSTAPFKVLVSGSGWTKAKGEGGDSWAAFLHERNALFEFIRVNEIEGVVLVSGDTHVGELNAIPWSEQGGYDFYDLVSSPLAQAASSNWRNRDPEVRLRPGFEAPNVGLLRFDMRGDPTLTFNLYGEDGQPAWEPLSLKASQLRNGVASHTTRPPGSR